MSVEKALFDKIKEIITEFDPVGIAHITPDDEFDDFSNQIVPLLKNSGDVNELRQHIHNLFLKEFGEGDFDVNKVEHISDKIWSLKQDSHGGN
jgi:hypothetical protein